MLIGLCRQNSALFCYRDFRAFVGWCVICIQVFNKHDSFFEFMKAAAIELGRRVFPPFTLQKWCYAFHWHTVFYDFCRIPSNHSIGWYIFYNNCLSTNDRASAYSYPCTQESSRTYPNIISNTGLFNGAVTRLLPILMALHPIGPHILQCRCAEPVCRMFRITN